MVHSNDHEEADLKLVALVRGYECGNNEKLLVRSPSGDIDVIVLFMLYSSGRHIFLDVGHGDTRKIIDISCAILLKIEYQGYQEYMHFQVTIIFQVFSRKPRKNSGKHGILWNILIYLEI